MGFRALQSRCEEMSSSVLRQRLNELATSELVSADESGRYVLTDAGAELLALLTPLKEWADDWGRRRQ